LAIVVTGKTPEMNLKNSSLNNGGAMNACLLPMITMGV
jgi:hypothetical protein